GEAALARLRGEVPGACAELVRLDLASLASVEAAAADVSARLDRLDLLIDNAGVMAIARELTEDGFEKQLGTNHLGHFALTGRLLPLLLAAPAPRVVVVSSQAHRSGRLNLTDLMSERAYTRWGAYGQSKLANLLFAHELHRRSAGGPLLVAAAHPGYAATNLQSGQRSLLLELGMKVGNLLLAQSDRRGAWPQLYAATMGDVQGDDYFGPDGIGQTRGHPRRVGRSQQAQDEVAGQLLWTVSEELTGVTYDALG
ncbi:MAG: family NAD(P)-dependent oxidoreductase, partial [Frankiales bacterium]|nr:family NAD(P)-dependent oxidoreductase [Frankiales bacterium]